MSWHSQFGEDKWLFEQGLCGVSGTFCEVGAYDGVSGSNTLAFEEMGWTGVCVEPDPAFAMLSAHNRKASTLACAIGTGGSFQLFHVNQADRGTSGLKRIKTGNHIVVPVCRLDDLFLLTGAPDLLSVDTEGSELEVWDTIGGYRPRVVIMEFWTQPNPPQSESIVKQMTADGYQEVHRTEANLIFVKA